MRVLFFLVPPTLSAGTLLAVRLAYTSPKSPPRRHCQTKSNRYPKVVMHPPSGRKLAPLGQGSGAVLLEDVAAVEVAILVEVVVD